MSDQSFVLRQVLQALEENHAMDVLSLDVRTQTSVTDYMLICSGRSSRQVKAIAQNLTEIMKKLEFSPLSITGLEQGEWVLIDFGDIVVHVMQPETRRFYDLEGVWGPH